jgi:transcriptional regulator with XRE-family HTH domain
VPNATETIGQRLRGRRAKFGLTLAQVAERSGLSLPYVSNLERGRGNPTLDALGALAEALDMSLSALVGEDVAQPLDLTMATAPKSLLRFIGSRPSRKSSTVCPSARRRRRRRCVSGY